MSVTAPGVRAKIIQNGYKAFKKGLASKVEYTDILHDDVTLKDWDQDKGKGLEVKTGKEAVIAYLESLRMVITGEAKFKEVGGEVICVDHIVRGNDNHACVDRFTFTPENKILHIDICYVKGPDILCPCPPGTSGPGIESPSGAPRG